MEMSEQKQPIYVAIAGTKHYYGTEFMKPGQDVQFVKEPDNACDEEAVIAQMKPLGKVGYIANSPYTVPKGCRSAGRIYDTFGWAIGGIVRFVIGDTVIVELTDEAEGIEGHWYSKFDFLQFMK